MATKSKAKEIVDQRLVKALGHPLRVEILSILNERVASPNQLAQELGEGLSQVSYHVKVLKEYECVELVKTEPRRGAVEHFYRGIERYFLDDANWRQLPKSLQGSISATALEVIVEGSVEAMKNGTFDARDDRHVSWTPLIVDEEGWRDLTSLLAGTLEQVLDIQAQSAGRLAETRAEGIPANVAVLGFEAPTPEQKQASARRKP